MKKFLIVIMICFALLYKSELHAFEYQYDVYGDMIFTLTDVKEDFWAFKDIKSMFLSELVTGYPDGSFKPQNPMSRGEFFKLISLISDKNEESIDDSFLEKYELDNHWSYKYMKLCVKKGLLKESDEIIKLSKINEPISRAEVALMIGRNYNLDQKIEVIQFGKGISRRTGEMKFSDVENLKDEVKKAIDRLYVQNIISGYPDGSFQPQNSMNRAEMMSILNRYIKTLKDTYAPTRRIRTLKQEEKNEKERLKKQQQEIEDKKYEADLTYLNEDEKWFKGGTPMTGDVKVKNGKKYIYVSGFDWIPWQKAHKGGGVESEGKGYIPSPYQIGDGVNRKMSKEEYIEYVKRYNIDWDKLGITIDDAVKHYFKEELKQEAMERAKSEQENQKKKEESGIKNQP